MECYGVAAWLPQFDVVAFFVRYIYVDPICATVRNLHIFLSVQTSQTLQVGGATLAMEVF